MCSSHCRIVGVTRGTRCVEAARATRAGEIAGTPKSAGGSVEAVRIIRLPRPSAIKARTRTVNQLRALVGAAPARRREIELETGEHVQSQCDRDVVANRYEGSDAVTELEAEPDIG